MKGIEALFFDNAVQNRVSITDNIQKFYNVWEQLNVNSAQVYQWGKQLQAMKLYPSAILCYEIASQANAPEHIQLNSRFQAASLRFSLQHELDKAKADLIWIIQTAPDSIPARDAGELLEKLRVAHPERGPQ